MKCGSGMVTGAFTFCWTVRAGASTSRKSNQYKELEIQPWHKTSKRRVKVTLRDDRVEAVGRNAVWAMDFVHDRLAIGKKLRV